MERDITMGDTNSITVRSGDTLSAIVKKQYNLTNSADIYKKVKEVAALNGIKNPNSIFTGQKISFAEEQQPVKSSQSFDTNQVSKSFKNSVFTSLSTDLKTSPKTSAKSTSKTSAASSSGKSGKPSNAMDKPFTGTAEDLNKNLSGVLAGKGEKLLDLQDKYGVSASGLAAMAMWESGRGTSKLARTKNNVGGVRSGRSYKSYDSVDDCLESMASNLSRNYIAQGRTTVDSIGRKYAQDKNWANGVGSIKRSIESSVA